MANGHCLAQGRALQYFPKKTKAVYTAAYLADCRQKINTRPRKCLNFASPAQQFSRCLKSLNRRIAFVSWIGPLGTYKKEKFIAFTSDDTIEKPKNFEDVIAKKGDEATIRLYKSPKKWYEITKKSQ